MKKTIVLTIVILVGIATIMTFQYYLNAKTSAVKNDNSGKITPIAQKYFSKMKAAQNVNAVEFTEEEKDKLVLDKELTRDAEANLLGKYLAEEAYSRYVLFKQHPELGIAADKLEEMEVLQFLLTKRVDLIGF